MRPAFIAMIALCALLCAPRAIAQPRLERQLARADALILRGRPQQALPILRRLARQPEVDARVAIAFASAALPATPTSLWAAPEERRLAPVRETIALLERVTSDTPEQTRALRLAGARARGLTGDLAPAIGELASMRARLASDVAGALSWLAALAVVRDDLALAERALEAAVIASSEDDVIARDLAAVCLARGTPLRAVRVLEGRVARPGAPERAGQDETRRDLAAALLAAGDARRALTLLAAIATAHDDAPSHLDAARAALEAQDAARARRSAEIADGARGATRTTRTEAPLVLAEACLALTDRDCARRAFTTALERDPASTRAREGLRALDAAP